MILNELDDVLGQVAAGDGAHDSPTRGGERVVLLQHALQCGHELAMLHPSDLELQLAGLLHDIGHQLVPGDDAGHGRAGADAVRHLFGQRVGALIELHVPAKRYLVATDPSYRDILSPTSTQTLGRQGGMMTPAEVAEFELHPYWRAAVALRRADEAAKVPDRRVPGLTVWRPVAEQVRELVSR